MDLKRLLWALPFSSSLAFWHGVFFQWGAVVTIIRNNSNKIMRYRVIFQALALLIFVLLLWFREPRG